MAGSKVPRDPNISPEVRRFLDDLARLADTLNAADNAPIASPTFTGDPKAPTPSPGDNDTSIATTAFVTAAIAAIDFPRAELVGSATASGATVSITGLPSSPMFVVVFSEVSHNDAGTPTLRVALSDDNGANYGTAFTVSSPLGSGVSTRGTVHVSRADITGSHPVVTGVPSALGGLESTETGPVNAMQFSWSSGSFDAGNIYIYGF
jgi:hypothetical protein